MQGRIPKKTRSNLPTFHADEIIANTPSYLSNLGPVIDRSTAAGRGTYRAAKISTYESNYRVLLCFADAFMYEKTRQLGYADGRPEMVDSFVFYCLKLRNHGVQR
jgi:hypothetical protein